MPAVILALAFAGFILACIWGWVSNLINLIGTESPIEITVLLLVQAVGVVIVPIGVVLGWIV
jgi:hypothetical protein